jgi:hypothetical protein
VKTGSHRGGDRGVQELVLLVRQAAIFHLDHRVNYNTVFNEETIETRAAGKTSEQLRLAPREQ